MKAWLFDLDGTLVDTAPDMVAALNRLRADYGHHDLQHEQLRAYVSRGANAMIGQGFPDADDEQREALREAFLDTYADKLCVHTVIFDGLLDMLSGELPHHGWGIVTNKPGFLARPLVDALGLRPGALLCGDCLPVRKPDPEPLLEACRRIGCAPEQAVYVGDAESDIRAGRAAGMHTIAAAYGYIPHDDDIDSWQADDIVHSPRALVTRLRELDSSDADGKS